ncbi:DUF3576 domain-containing protein [Pedomonas mirosovicensis]|uniref:DUF3576 domain-containing protein n=1 Tax=Pedomonas mirosovicensis TaxID=2908641 RepID=UPI0021698B2C|nr:DUF3576 domain-containing protein [Pedomonas mirosovicensis]MCH8684119.1 DUF3576 domain-containing protein [Pedomonas mirosovicensis]
MKLVVRIALGLGTALGLAACGGGDHPTPAKLPPAKVTTLGINTYLWRAALDVLSFMPTTQVDANSGVILTDWKVNPKVPNERFKLSAYVLDRDLRADAIKVAVQRQVQQNGAWVDAPVQAGTVQKLEDAILTRARQIRQGSVGVE